MHIVTELENINDELEERKKMWYDWACYLENFLKGLGYEFEVDEPVTCDKFPVLTGRITEQERLNDLLDGDIKKWSGWACDLELELEKKGYQIIGPSVYGLTNCKKLVKPRNQVGTITYDVNGSYHSHVIDN
jgi:hypothetical protein